jgi:hypothetical protein
VVYPVLEFREKKQTFTEVERDNVDFFLQTPGPTVTQNMGHV